VQYGFLDSALTSRGGRAAAVPADDINGLGSLERKSPTRTRSGVQAGRTRSRSPMGRKAEKLSGRGSRISPTARRGRCRCATATALQAHAALCGRDPDLQQANAFRPSATRHHPDHAVRRSGARADPAGLGIGISTRSENLGDGNAIARPGDIDTIAQPLRPKRVGPDAKSRRNRRCP